MLDAWPSLAPSTEHNDVLDLFSQRSKLDTSIEYSDISADLGLPDVNTEEDLHDYHEMKDDVYKNHMR